MYVNLNKYSNVPFLTFVCTVFISSNNHIQVLDRSSKAGAALVKTITSNNNNNCRMCSQKQETVTHIMSACSKIAQSLYTACHDKMLRPYYHYLLPTYGFKAESDHKRPWYQQRLSLIHI